MSAIESIDDIGKKSSDVNNADEGETEGKDEAQENV